jgi:hypothetical protein
MTWALNTVRLVPVVTPRIRLVFTHARPFVAGVTEIAVWSER